MPEQPPTQRAESIKQLGLADLPHNEERFLRIVRTVQRLFGVPMAFLSLVAEHQVRYISSIGLDFEETPLALSFSNHVIRQDALFLVNDTRSDARFTNNPLVCGDPFVRCFAGAPLTTHKGVRIGVLGVMDFRTRELNEPEQQALIDLAAWANRELNSPKPSSPQTPASSESRVRAVLNHVRDGIMTINIRGAIESFNPAAESIFGYKADEVIGKNFMHLLDDPNIAISSAESFSTQPHLSEKLGTGGEVIGRRRDGSQFPMELSISDMWLGQYRVFTVIVRDITERKLSEQNLMEREERYRDLFENAGDLIQSVTPDGRFLYVNRAWRETLGYQDHDLSNLTVWDIILPESRARYAKAFERVLGGEKLDRIEVVFVARGGKRIYVEGSMSGKVDEQTFISTQGIFRDITQRKKIEEMKNEFISIVSHELRTPMTSIHGSLGLLAGGVAGPLPDKAQSMLRIAYKNSERLVRLINDILDLEKLSSGKMEFYMAPTPLMPLIQQALESNHAYCQSFGVSCSLQNQLPHAKVFADSDRLIQVLTNLLSNAAKFSPEGGSIDISLQRNVGFLKVNVRDHGPGIPEEFRERIFERFAQAYNQGPRQKGGSGLGLSICKAIIERMDGRIGFHTETGKGTTFFFELPEFHD